MTNEQILAKAILELARLSAYEWDYDGEQLIATGVQLESEAALEKIALGDE